MKLIKKRKLTFGKIKPATLMMRLAAILSMMIFFSCQSKSDKIFWIDENLNGKSDLLFLAESTNVQRIETDSMRFYFTAAEIEAIGNIGSAKSPIFKSFGKIYETENFKLQVIFRDGQNSLGRDYQFMLRSFNAEGKIIDSYKFASWVKSENEYCFGSISEKLIIERKCKDLPVVEKYWVSPKGYFMKM